MRVGCAFLYNITRFGFPPTFDDSVRALYEIKELGYHSAELEVDIDENLEDYIRKEQIMKSALKELDMQVSGVIGVVQQGFSTDDTTADKALEKFKTLCGFISRIGTKYAIICTYMPAEIKLVKGTEIYRGSPPLQLELPKDFKWSQFWANAVKRFKKMAEVAKEHGLDLIIENRVGDFASTSEGLLNLLQQSGMDNVGLLLDIAHMNATKEHLEIAISKCANYIKYVHLSDNDGTSSKHNAFGNGNIDFKRVLKSLKHIGFNGYINVDVGGVSDPKLAYLESRKSLEAILKEL